VANALRARFGAEKTQRVAIVADNSLEHCVLWVACAALGCTTVVIDFSAPSEDLIEVMKDTEPIATLMQAGDDRIEEVRKVGFRVWEFEGDDLLVSDEETLSFEPNRDTEIPWAILYTSGTTSGVKKGAVRTQRQMIEGYFQHLLDMDFRSYGEVFLNIYPLHGVSSFFFVNMMIYIGASILLLPRESSTKGSSLHGAIASFPVTFTTSAPAHLVSIIDFAEKSESTEAVDKIRQVLSSGAMSSKAIQERIKHFFSRSRFFEVYGSTEAGIITMLHPSEFAKNAGSVGCEVVGNPQLKFFDPESEETVSGTRENPGEIAVKTPMLFSEYWRKDDFTKQCMANGEFFKTGDVGFKNEHGFLFLLGRVDDRITLASGASLYPSEIERVLLRHKSVSQATVFLEDGGSIVALLLMRDEKASNEDLHAHCTASLPRLFVPSIFWLDVDWNKLPRTATGKIKRNQLPDFFKIERS